MDRGTWWAIVHEVAESDTSEKLKMDRRTDKSDHTGWWPLPDQERRERLQRLKDVWESLHGAFAPRALGTECMRGVGKAAGKADGP